VIFTELTEWDEGPAARSYLLLLTCLCLRLLFSLDCMQFAGC